MPKSQFTKFDVYWWAACAGPELGRYATRRSTDIECFSSNHYRIHVHSLDGTGEILQLILTRQDGVWIVKCDGFDNPSEAYPFAFSKSEDRALWTNAEENELMVIQASV